MTPIAVVTTVASRAEAQAMAQALVERRLVACAQISDIESFYRWQGRVQHDPECRVVFKTTRERYAQVERMIRDLHSYELPEIHALAFEAVSAPYAAWIVQSCDGAIDNAISSDGVSR
jgi:periplasmic divalent cation tolerance protein